MWHADIGKSTFDIWEDEQREERLAKYRRHKQLENIVNGLANLMRKRMLVDEERAAVEDMIEEGGPLNDNEQGGHDD